jgi:hypothetical protein
MSRSRIGGGGGGRVVSFRSGVRRPPRRTTGEVQMRNPTMCLGVALAGVLSLAAAPAWADCRHYVPKSGDFLCVHHSKVTATAVITVVSQDRTVREVERKDVDGAKGAEAAYRKHVAAMRAVAVKGTCTGSATCKLPRPLTVTATQPKPTRVDYAVGGETAKAGGFIAIKDTVPGHKLELRGAASYSQPDGLVVWVILWFHETGRGAGPALDLEHYRVVRWPGK